MGKYMLLGVFQCRQKLTSTFAGEERRVRRRSSETYKHEWKARAKQDIKEGIAKGGGTVERCRVTEKKKKKKTRQKKNSLFSSLLCGTADKGDQYQTRCSSESRARCVWWSPRGHVMSLELDEAK